MSLFITGRVHLPLKDLSCSPGDAADYLREQTRDAWFCPGAEKETRQEGTQGLH